MDLRNFAADPARVEALQRGVGVMKARRASDPTSWFFQAAIHGVSQDAIDQAQQNDPGVADAAKFWNQCPHHGQPSANFLIWHRAYIYYFEAILRAASGDATLSLPYWNYTDGDRGFPALFADPQPDSDNNPTNPLYDARRESAFAGGLYTLSEGAVTTAQIMSESEFFGPDESSGLAGGVGDEDPETKGALELRPHDLIHVAVGGMVLTPSGDRAGGLMSDPLTAAFDPIFWVHHANVDRLWSIWDCLPSKQWGSVPVASWLDQRPWNFFDADGSVRSAARRFYLNRRNLAVAYDSDQPGCQPLSATRPEPVVASARTLGEARSAEAAVKTLEFDKVSIEEKSGVQVGPDARVDSTIALQSERPEIRGLRSLLDSETPDTGEKKIVVELRGIRTMAPPSVGFDVFVDLPEGATADRSDDRFIGTLSLFGLGHHGEHDHAINVQRFDITNWIRKHGGDPKTIKISVVPFDLFEPKPGQPRLRRDDGITIESIRVVVRGDSP